MIKDHRIAPAERSSPTPVEAEISIPKLDMANREARLHYQNVFFSNSLYYVP